MNIVIHDSGLMNNRSDMLVVVSNESEWWNAGNAADSAVRLSV